jgi:hypothetical protein
MFLFTTTARVSGLITGILSWTDTAITGSVVSGIVSTAVIGKCGIISEYKCYLFFVHSNPSTWDF